MKKQMIGFILPFLLYMSLPLEAMANLSIIGIYSPVSRSPGSSFWFRFSVSDSNGVVEGQKVTFSVSPADGTVSLNPTSATTDSDGLVSTWLNTGSGSTGVYTVTATAGGTSGSGNATIKAPPPPPPELSISVVSGLGSGAPGDSLTFTVKVQEDGSPASGKTVTFSITSGDGNASLSATSATTGSNGQASTKLTLGASASGSYTVTATVGSKSTSGTATVNTSPPPPPPPPPELSINVIRGPGSGRPGSGLTFTVEVQEDGSPASGKGVTFSVSPDNETVLLTATSLITNSNGRAETTLLLLSGAFGSYTITVTVGSKSISRTATVGTSPPPPPPPPPPPELSISVVSGLGSGAPGDSLTFTVKVQEDGSPASGKTVTFSITSGDGNASLSATSATTGSNGQASTKLTLGASASGSYTVTATVGSKSTSGTATVDSARKRRTLGPRSRRTLVISSNNSGSVLPGDTVTFTAEVKEGGNSVQGQRVTFSLSPNNGTASLSTAIAITDSVGQAQTTLILGNDASGVYTITASVNFLSVDSTVTVETVPTERPTSQQQQLDLAIDSNPTPRGASVTVSVSQNGNPAENQPVKFSVSPDDGTVSLSTTSTTTDSDGQASTTLSAGSDSAGLYKVTATLNDDLTGGTVSLPLILEPTVLLIVSGDNQTGLTSEALISPFVVEVRDQYDDPLVGVTVTFTVSTGGGSLSNTRVDTDANGLAESTLILSDPGTNIVEVSAEGISETVTFTAKAIPPTLTSVSGNNQSAAVGTALAHPFVVEVRDGNGTPLSGVVVTFVVLTGGGTLTNPTATTDANGQADSTLHLGTEPGTNTVEVSAEGISEIVTFSAVAELLEFDLFLPADLSLIHVPLKVTAVDGVAKTIKSVADLYDVLGGANDVNLLLTFDSHTQEGVPYILSSDRGTPNDRELTDDMGIFADMKIPKQVRLTGSPLGTNGSSSITLNPKLNFVGLPLNDSRLTHVSDLLALEGIDGNASVVIFMDNGKGKAVTPAGGPDDIEITGGQAFILEAQQAATVAISGRGWTTDPETASAPSIAGKGLGKTDSTAVLALIGSVSGVKHADFRVAVMNRSTPKAITRSTATVNGDDGVGYRLAIVDVKTGRAAQVGDVLEVSAQTQNPSVKVHSLQYTVTTEDVSRSLIQLPELVAYEIPTETKLLANYPNPFNPETWIPYRLAEDALVTLTIYDGTGRVVRSLDVGYRIAAVYENRSKAIYWDGRNEFGEQVASGLYFYHLSAADYSKTRRMVILK